MYNNETQELIMTLIDHAKTAKPSEFRFIHTWRDYQFCKGKVNSFKLLIRGFNETSDHLFKKYCDGVSHNVGNLNQLLAYQQLQQIIRFYENELVTYLNMVCEYKAYLKTGHLLSATFFGEIREDSDLYDFRE